jgi:hypothetical protein
MPQTLLPPRYCNGPLQVRPPQDEGLIATILSDEALYGDGPPQWSQGKSKKPCKSASEADAERTKLIKVLCKRRHISTYTLDVARRLYNCRPETRCLSGACPCCVRAFQRWLVIAGDEILKQSAARGQPTKILSIIPTKAIPTNGGSGDR